MIVPILSTLLGLSAVVAVVSTYLLIKASGKLIQFDDLGNYLVDDVETNVTYFDTLTNTPTLSNAPEIVEANQNMRLMSARLDEYLNRFEELTGSKVRKKTSPKPPIVG